MVVRFKKRLIDDVRYEAAAVFDVNNDGVLDIVCGEYWYEGPAFTAKHKICDVEPVGEYFDDFCDYGMDVNGDGWKDIITGGWWGETLRWRENPRGDGLWKVHDVDRCGSVETIRFYDIDGCGTLEVFPNTPGAPQVFYKLIMDAAKRGKPAGRFQKVVISEGASGHGMGFGDINGNGKMDVILARGWLEQPADLFNSPWEFHPEFDLGSASVPILAYDVTGNGLADLIVGQAHNYGLAWWEQVIGESGARTWVKHDIDPTASQYHDLWLVDIDGDGELELITGKRYRAHNDSDPGSADPVGIYYFKIDGGRFVKHVIDYGPAGQASGCGIYFWVEDINGDGRPDIVAPGKDGLYLFENLGS
jgi:hypothetical protein